MKRFFSMFVLTVALASGMSMSVAGQDMLQANLDFDARMNAQMSAMQQQLNQNQANFWQGILQDPGVQAGYEQHRAQGGQYSYEQFAYWYVMTANGTNYQGAMDAQRQQFEGLKRAHQTVQEGYNNYNIGWHENQNRIDAAMQRYSEGAIRGNWYYQDPTCGQYHTLPYTSGPGYYTQGNNNYYMDATGQYYMQTGNSWTPMNMMNR